MVRNSRKSMAGASAHEENPDVSERKRLKKLALLKNMISDKAAIEYSPLRPSPMVLKHHGKDILKKYQRKNKFLFSFPGLVAPTTGGKIGDLKDLGTKNPIVYFDFPQGRMKLFGTIVFPRNKYFTLQFSKGGKHVLCDDCFDNMIVFSDVWWIGTKEENPDEVRLEFPKELEKDEQPDYEFKGGVGVRCSDFNNINKKQGRQQHSKDGLKVDTFGGVSNPENTMMATPVRQSGRTARKSFNFVDSSSSDYDESYNDHSDSEKDNGLKSNLSNELFSRDEILNDFVNFENSKDDVGPSTYSTKRQGSKPSESTVNKRGKISFGQGSLIQPTILSLFKEAKEKGTIKSPIDLSSRVSDTLDNPDLSRNDGDDQEGSNDNIQGTKRMSARQFTKKSSRPAGVEEDDVSGASSEDEDDDDGNDEDWVGSE